MSPLGICLTPAPCALLLACAASGSPVLAPSDSLAILPFRPLDASVEDVALAQAALTLQLRSGPSGGLRIVPEETVEDALRARRIRVVETFTAETASFLTSRLDGAMLLTGTLLYARAAPAPEAALLIRLFGSDGRRLGSMLWMERSEDTADGWGLDAVTSMDELFELGALELSARLKARGSAMPDSARPRIAVLPFDSAMDEQGVGLLAALMTAHALEEEFGVGVVEPGDLLDGFRRAQVRTLDMLGVDGARRLAEEVGVRWLVTGSVLEMDYGSGLEPPPRLSLILRLFDAQARRTVKSISVSRSGDEGETVLGAGLTPHPVLNMQTALLEGLSQLENAWLSS